MASLVYIKPLTNFLHQYHCKLLISISTFVSTFHLVFLLLLETLSQNGASTEEAWSLCRGSEWEELVLKVHSGHQNVAKHCMITLPSIISIDPAKSEVIPVKRKSSGFALSW